MAAKPRLSVIVVSWNTRELTLQAVASVLAQPVDGGCEVLVVDNGSADGTVDALRERFPTVRVLPVGRNLGFSGGNNLGLWHSRGEYTLLLNSDAVLRPGALAALLAAADAHPAAGVLQPLVVWPDGSPQPCFGYVPTVAAELRYVLHGARRWADPAWQAELLSWREPREVVGFGLAALLVPRRVWPRVGLLPDESFLFFEESALAVRLEQAGLKPLLVPGAVVEHHQGRSTGQMPLRSRRAHYLSRLWFYRTYRDPLQVAIVRAWSLLRAGVGLLTAGAEEREQLWRPIFAEARR